MPRDTTAKNSRKTRLPLQNPRDFHARRVKFAPIAVESCPAVSFDRRARTAKRFRFHVDRVASGDRQGSSVPICG